jgi:hypothetical protein
LIHPLSFKTLVELHSAKNFQLLQLNVQISTCPIGVYRVYAAIIIIIKIYAAIIIIKVIIFHTRIFTALHLAFVHGTTLKSFLFQYFLSSGKKMYNPQHTMQTFKQGQLIQEAPSSPH